MQFIGTGLVKKAMDYYINYQTLPVEDINRNR